MKKKKNHERKHYNNITTNGEHQCNSDKDSANLNKESLSNRNNLDSNSLHGFNNSIDNLSVGEDKGIESDKMNCLSSHMCNGSYYSYKDFELSRKIESARFPYLQKDYTEESLDKDNSYNNLFNWFGIEVISNEQNVLQLKEYYKQSTCCLKVNILIIGPSKNSFIKLFHQQQKMLNFDVYHVSNFIEAISLMVKLNECFRCKHKRCSFFKYIVIEASVLQGNLDGIIPKFNEIILKIRKNIEGGSKNIYSQQIGLGEEGEITNRVIELFEELKINWYKTYFTACDNRELLENLFLKFS